MTEAEWVGGNYPAPMLAFLRDKASDRKLRLFVCGCCRHVWHFLTDERSRNAVSVGERYADGLANDSEREVSRLSADIGGDYFDAESRADPSFGIVVMTQDAVSDAEKVRQGQEAWRWAAGLMYPAPEDYDSLLEAESTAFERLCGIVRCIFGNPFRSVAFNPTWRTEAVVGLARGMYESRDFAPMPVLADSLEDAGCASADILAHCRGDGPHVRGCWVVDLVLGKN